LGGAGSMAFSWDEPNASRDRVFRSLGIAVDRVAAIELGHGQDVFFFTGLEEIYGRKGDGLLTANRDLVPSITVADCLPIYLFDLKSGSFGLLHSGWRGTGIVLSALRALERLFGTRARDVVFVFGPCIGSCCYEVGRERALAFLEAYGRGSAVERRGKWYLSLRDANINLLSKRGVTSINVVRNCTCCCARFGSFRREAVLSGKADGSPPEGLSFTRMAAMTGWF
jgi:YfiH family protein